MQECFSRQCCWQPLGQMATGNLWLQQQQQQQQQEQEQQQEGGVWGRLLCHLLPLVHSHHTVVLCR